MSSGLLATIAWGFVLVIYCTFRVLGIEDPILGNVFQLLTGAWIAALTLAQGKKTSKVEDRLEKLTALAKSEHPELAGELDEQN